MSWVATWSKWSRANKLAAISAAVAIFLGCIQAVQMGYGVYVWIEQKLGGQPLLSIPLKKIHAGMIEELEYNIDCLNSFNVLRFGDVSYKMCKIKTLYTDNWFYHISVLKTRDYYSESLYTESDWEDVKSFYRELENVRQKSDFIEIERRSQITLRDALFLTGYVRYFYKNFFEKSMSEKCSEQAFEENLSGDCKRQHDRLFGDAQAWQEQIEGWDGMPAKRTVDDVKPVRNYGDWLDLHD